MSVNIRLLKYHISEQMNIRKAENLSNPSTEQVVKKTNQKHRENIQRIYLIHNTNSTLTNMYDQSM